LIVGVATIIPITAKSAIVIIIDLSIFLSHLSVIMHINNNPLCRVVPLEILQKCEENINGKENGKTLNYYDKDKYREMKLDAAETVLGYFGFARTVYGMPMKNRKRKWYEELQDERTKDIQTEIL
jgi:hypothetical protein